MGEKYQLIAAEKANFRITMMCRVLGVSTSGFYEWEQRPASARARRRDELAVLVVDVFDRSGRTYGYRRVHAELARQGVRVDDETVRTLMREHDLVPLQHRRRRGLTVPDRHAGPVPDLVGRDFTGTAPGVKMVGDITQVDTGQGPLYVATVIDCYSKAVLGWATDDRYPAGLVCSALNMAALRIDLPAGAVFHSDRGSQYTSRQFAAVLARHGVVQSVGRTGSCFDNAMAESFFGKLKTELVHHRSFATRDEARCEIVQFIEGFYNRRRLHSTLGYRPPFEVLEEYRTSRVAA